MSLKRPRLVALAALFILAGCSPGAKPVHSVNHNAKIIDTIKADEVLWNDDWKSGDPAKVAAHYAPDAVVMGPGNAAAGAPAVLRGIQQAYQVPGFGLSFTSEAVTVAASGDMAASRGTYRMTMINPKTGARETQTGSYVTLWKPQKDGSWKAEWDINTPGPDHAVALASNAP